MIKPMLAHNYEDYKDRLVFPVWSQPKLDGLRAIATKDGLFSRLGNRFMTVPHIERALEGLFRYEPNLVLDGELYSHEHRNNFPELCSIIKRTKINDDVLERAKQIQFWVFDTVNNFEFMERFVKVMNVVSSVGHYHIKCVLTTQCDTLDDLNAEYDNLILYGFEGQIIRQRFQPYVNKRSAALLKRKEIDSEVVVVHDVIEGEGKWRGMAGCFYCQHPNGQFFHAALADNDDKRQEYWLIRDSLRGRHAEVVYQKLLPSGVPRHPRLKGLITL